jgi:hypothetical protein
VLVCPSSRAGVIQWLRDPGIAADEAEVVFLEVLGIPEADAERMMSEVQAG